MPEVVIGQVGGFFAKISVAGIDLTGELRVGDTIRIKGHTTDLTQTVESLQVEHDVVEQAGRGASIGLKVTGRCRKGDQVYRVTD